MASSGPITFTIKEDGINELIEERGNMVTMLREVAWGNREAHLEVRKWIVSPDEEKPMRGCSFMTEEGPHKLVEIMADNGYGDTKNVLKALSKREDFDDALVKTVGKKKLDTAKKTEVSVDEEEFFDPKAMVE